MGAQLDYLGVAWLAGWLEGEGHFQGLARSTGSTRLAVISVSTDHDTILKAQSIAGGRCYGPYQYVTNNQPYWKWCVAGRAAAKELMELLLPHMGLRRSAQIREALRVGGKSDRELHPLETKTCGNCGRAFTRNGRTRQQWRAAAACSRSCLGSMRKGMPRGQHQQS